MQICNDFRVRVKKTIYVLNERTLFWINYKYRYRKFHLQVVLAICSQSFHPNK